MAFKNEVILDKLVYQDFFFFAKTWPQAKMRPAQAGRMRGSKGESPCHNESNNLWP